MAQKQHRVSQVYLKGFGDKKDEQWMLPTMERLTSMSLHGIGKPWSVEDQDIRKLTITDGEFNLIDVAQEDQDALENFFGKLENQYPSVIRTLGQKQLHDTTRDYLAGFMATLLIRSSRFRHRMRLELEQPSLPAFLRTMTMYMDTKEAKARITNILEFAPTARLNHACYAIWHHLYYRLRDGSFKMVFMQDKEYGWPTCDDPVVIRNFAARGGSLLGRATEIYFPISREWCVFMYDSHCRYQLNPLRKHDDRSFIASTEWLRHVVWEEVLQNAARNIFFSHPLQYAGHVIPSNVAPRVS